MVVHFIDQARDLVAQDLDGDGIHVHAPCHDQVAVAVDLPVPAGRNDGCGVELLDQSRPRDRRADIEPVALVEHRVDHRSIERHASPALDRGWRRSAAMAPRRPRAARIWARPRARAGDSSPLPPAVPWPRGRGCGRDARRTCPAPRRAQRRSAGPRTVLRAACAIRSPGRCSAGRARARSGHRRRTFLRRQARRPPCVPIAGRCPRHDRR